MAEAAYAVSPARSGWIISFEDYAEYDGMGLAALVRSAETTPSEVLEACIERIERHNGVLNAVVHKAYDEASKTAAGELPDGPYKGVPLLIKDLGAQVEGWPRTSGSRFAQVAADARDSALVRRYRAAGAVLVGKTNTPEFGIPGVTNSERLGACRNPWNPDHISGGSSGGAAAATASGMVPMAHEHGAIVFPPRRKRTPHARRPRILVDAALRPDGQPVRQLPRGARRGLSGDLAGFGPTSVPLTAAPATRGMCNKR